MFQDNKYSRWYFGITERSKHRSIIGYKERHHVIPKSLGGIDDRSNIVELTSREHYICHALLVKMVFQKQHKYKMYCAFNMMHVDCSGQRYTSKLYEHYKHKFYKMHSEAQRGHVRSEESKRKQSEKTKGVPWSEYRRSISISKPTSIAVLVYLKRDGSFVGEFPSMNEASKVLNCDLASIWKILNNWHSKTPDGVLRPYKSHRGYTFKYKDITE